DAWATAPPSYNGGALWLNSDLSLIVGYFESVTLVVHSSPLLIGFAGFKFDGFEPSTTACSMWRPETPSTSLATEPSLILASSNTFWIRLAKVASICRIFTRIRVKSRKRRMVCGGTKL